MSISSQSNAQTTWLLVCHVLLTLHFLLLKNGINELSERPEDHNQSFNPLICVDNTFPFEKGSVFVTRISVSGNGEQLTHQDSSEQLGVILNRIPTWSSHAKTGFSQKQSVSPFMFCALNSTACSHILSIILFFLVLSHWPHGSVILPGQLA